MPSPLMDTEEAAAYLGMSPGTLRNYRCARTRGPKWIKPPGRNSHVKYRLSDLDAWLAEHTKEASA